MVYTITIEGGAGQFLCDDGQNVLAAMERIGRKGIPVGCRGGGCGICRVQVMSSHNDHPKPKYRTLKMSRAQVNETDIANGIVLACKLIPLSDLTLKPLGLLQQKLSTTAEFLHRARGGV